MGAKGRKEGKVKGSAINGVRFLDALLRIFLFTFPKRSKIRKAM